jgi:16S rRNA (cytidine1402-2'-O)-methyltransferase
VGTLFIVATPIGNLSDISPRALSTLREADLIACEDTRQTLKLLNHFQIQKPLTSYHDFNEGPKAVALAKKIESGLNVALVSDAGTPVISDPGYRLVRYCREHGLNVVGIPGPSAAIAALAVSGLPSEEFFFAGFLPSKKSARRDKLQSLSPLKCTLIFYEAPHRISETLEEMHEIFGDRLASVAREMTKLHEEHLFGKLSELRSQVKELGEFVVIVEGAAGEAAKKPELTREEVLKTLGLTRNQLYDLFFKK